MSNAAVGPIRITRWPGERLLYVLVVLAAIGIWTALVFSILGIVYAALLAVVFFVAHLAFITHLRGNGVRLGPDQMPELHGRIVELSNRIGLKRVPEAYVVQAGGALNALATRFLRSNVIVLFSDLLEACDDNDAARDFIVAHELGHLHAGHLRWRWFLLPGIVFPFLGTAWSRACEYTCDRYGMSATGGSELGLDGLTVLAAGGRHGPRVNRSAMVAQRADLDTVWMKIGVWLSTHPPIASRLVALDPSLGPPISGRGAALGALSLIVVALAVPTAVGAGALYRFWPELQTALAQAQATAPADPGAAAEASDAHYATVEAGIISLAEATEHFRAEHGILPASRSELYQYWSTLHPGDREPVDPWSHGRYAYEAESGEYVIRSTGPDLYPSDDDLFYSSAAAAPGGSQQQP